ncbi:MAG TPA: sodium-dependent transporter [Clostridiales bacterium]|nr:sodium-dependent transporter [Clostridiales bacterium]
MNKKRGSFSSRLGFVLAAAGSAVGLGNLWRFPYLAAKYGGGTFLVIYLILAVTFGYTLMTAEITLGRKTRLSAVGAYGKLDKRFNFIGLLTCLVPIIIVPYYGVVGGWILKYFGVFILEGAETAAADDYFTNFITNPWQPFVLMLVFLTITAVIVSFGVKQGVENASRFMMPVLVVLSVVIAVYSCTRSGAWEGVKYYITPHLSDVSVNTLLGALGQLFYSMSLAMGIMITYGSYMMDDNDIENSVKQIEIFDTGIAFLAGLMIIPAVFAFSGGDSGALNAGAGLMFVTMPKVFASMSFGSLIGAVFFLLVIFAALTSNISLFETVVSILCDEFHISRKLSCVITYIICVVLGLLSALGYGVLSGIAPLGMSFLDFFDFISNSVLMPIVAVLTCIFLGWVVDTNIITDEVKKNSTFGREGMFRIMLKWIAPIFLVAILVSSVLNALGIISI